MPQMKPNRKDVATGNNFRGNSVAATGQGGRPVRRTVSAVGKAAYNRSAAGVNPTSLPMKRQTEGSVLTDGNASKGAVQPRSDGGNIALNKFDKPGLPLKRQREGSVLTGSSAKTGAVQPHSGSNRATGLKRKGVD